MKPRQVESQLARVLSGAIAELGDPRIPLVVTVERVAVTPDYALARVYMSALGDLAPLIAALENARGRLQHEIAVSLRLRRTPHLEFYPVQDAPFSP